MSKKHEEYLRRNLLVCKAVGAEAAAQNALERLSTHKNPPKWVIEKFEAIQERIAPLKLDLAAHRDVAPDKPEYLYDTHE